MVNQSKIIQPKIPKPPVLKNVERRSSSLSLKSVQKIKEDIKNSIELTEDYHPKDAFTEKELLNTWKNYQKILLKEGQKNMASILATNSPSLQKGFDVQFVLPNNLMKEQLKLGKPKLLKYLRESLNNFRIKIEIVVNETDEKKYAYTPLEKYKKLKEKNPLLQKLKDTFELDL